MAKLEDELETARQLRPDSNEAGAERCYWHLKDTVCHGFCSGFREGCEDYERTASRVFQLEAETGGDKRGELEKNLNRQEIKEGIGGGYLVGAAASPHSSM